jgi:hypothetical protein
VSFEEAGVLELFIELSVLVEGDVLLFMVEPVDGEVGWDGVCCSVDLSFTLGPAGEAVPSEVCAYAKPIAPTRAAAAAVAVRDLARLMTILLVWMTAKGHRGWGNAGFEGQWFPA